MSVEGFAKPELVLFDVGGVLVQLKPWEQALTALSEGRDHSELRTAATHFVQSESFRAFEKGKLAVPELCCRLRETLGLPLSEAEIRDFYLGILGPETEGMLELIQELKERGYRVCGLSDTSPIHLEKLVDYPAVAALDRLVTSCETGFQKPAREAYQRALWLLDASPKHTLFVDDRPENVQGAREHGMQALVLAGPAALRQNLGLEL